VITAGTLTKIRRMRYRKRPRLVHGSEVESSASGLELNVASPGASRCYAAPSRTARISRRHASM